MQRADSVREIGGFLESARRATTWSLGFGLGPPGSDRPDADAENLGDLVLGNAHPVEVDHEGSARIARLPLLPTGNHGCQRLSQLHSVDSKSIRIVGAGRDRNGEIDTPCEERVHPRRAALDEVGQVVRSRNRRIRHVSWRGRLLSPAPVLPCPLGVEGLSEERQRGAGAAQRVECLRRFAFRVPSCRHDSPASLRSSNEARGASGGGSRCRWIASPTGRPGHSRLAQGCRRLNRHGSAVAALEF